MARVLAVFIFLAVFAAAQPPEGYYAAAEGLSGIALKGQLRTIIDEHTVIAYTDLPPVIRLLWEDPNDPAKIQLIYGGTPPLKTSTSWNREHLWPRSLGVNPNTAADGGPDDSDLFHVVPADSNVNSARNNLYFDFSRVEDGGFRDPAHVEAPTCSRDANSWQPPAGERGDIARALFYMAVRYDGSEPGTADLELLIAAPGAAQMANLATLLAWHSADPPDAAEQARNDLIFTAYQHNRNPFIDRPEWVSAIWGTVTGAPTAQLSVSNSNVYEIPGAPVTFRVTLNTPAQAGGLVLTYSVTGTATAGSDYTLAGTGLDTVAQTISIPAGATISEFALSPISSLSKEAAELLSITLAPQANWDLIGGPAMVTLFDEQTNPRELLASWSFDHVPLPAQIPATAGAGFVNTSTWSGTVFDFSGVSGRSLGLEGTSNTNSFIECSFSTLGWTNLQLTFATRGNEVESFTSGTWSWSNGGPFTSISGVNTVATGTVFQSRLLDLSAIPSLQNQSSVTLRYHLSGAGNSQANNRIDDLTITGHRYTAGWLARFPALSGAAANPAADPDGDGANNFQEWAFDRDPLAYGAASAGTIGWITAPDPADHDLPKEWLAITFVRRKDTIRLLVFPEESENLLDWANGCVLLSTTAGPSPESETVTYRASVPLGRPAQFLRLRLSEE